MAEDKACQRGMREVRASKRMAAHVLSSAMDIARACLKELAAARLGRAVSWNSPCAKNVRVPHPGGGALRS